MKEKINKNLVTEANADLPGRSQNQMQLQKEESTAKKSHGPVSTVTGGEAKRKAVT